MGVDLIKIDLVCTHQKCNSFDIRYPNNIKQALFKYIAQIIPKHEQACIDRDVLLLGWVSLDLHCYIGSVVMKFTPLNIMNTYHCVVFHDRPHV